MAERQIPGTQFLTETETAQRQLPGGCFVNVEVSSGVTGTSSTTMSQFTSSASGTTTVIGTSSKTIDLFTSSAFGDVGGEVSGTVSVTMDPFVSSASGFSGSVTGTSDIIMDAFICSASGTVVSQSTVWAQSVGGYGGGPNVDEDRNRTERHRKHLESLAHIQRKNQNKDIVGDIIREFKTAKEDILPKEVISQDVIFLAPQVDSPQDQNQINDEISILRQEINRINGDIIAMRQEMETRIACALLLA